MASPVALTLGAGGLVLGRRELRDSTASRRHVEFSPLAAGWVVRDLGSRNGTWVEGRRRGGPHLLASGDVVRVGRSVLVFDAGGERSRHRRGRLERVLEHLRLMGATELPVDAELLERLLCTGHDANLEEAVASAVLHSEGRVAVTREVEALLEGWSVSTSELP